MVMKSVMKVIPHICVSEQFFIERCRFQ